MTKKIDSMAARSGRVRKEDDTVVNQADMIEAIYNALVVNKDAGVALTESDIQQPVDAQSRYSKTIQTHDAVTVGAGSISTQTDWVDCKGFNEIAVTFTNDAATNALVELYWSNDGANVHGTEQIISPGTLKWRTGSESTKARYVKVNLQNSDSASHIMSAWAYLKV